MKPVETTVLIALLITTAACRPRQTDNGTKMMLDSKPEGKNVTIVRPKEAVHPLESVTDIKDLPTTMQLDLDAPKRVPSKEVVFVKPGDTARPSETRP